MKKILIIEDDKDLQEELSCLLERNGYATECVTDFGNTWKSMRETDADLILLDLTLPDGSGFEICKKVRKTSNVPIIFLTASDEEVNIVMGLDIGGDDYITKPFRLNELISRINALLRRSNIMNRSGCELV